MNKLFAHKIAAVWVLLAVMLLFKPEIGFSQDGEAAAKKATISEDAEEFANELTQNHKAGMAMVKMIARHITAGKFFGIMSMSEKKNREYVGISNGQWENISDEHKRIGKKLIEDMLQYRELARSENPEEQEEFNTIFCEKYESLMSKINDDFIEQLSEEQLERIEELKLALPLTSVLGDKGAINYDGYDLLELSEIQKKHFAEMKNEYINSSEDSLEIRFELHALVLEYELKGELKKDTRIFEELYNKKVEGIRVEIDKLKEISKKHRKRIDQILTETQKAKLAATIEKVDTGMKNVKENAGNEQK